MNQITVQNSSTTDNEIVAVSLRGINGYNRKGLECLLSKQKSFHCKIVDEDPKALHIIDIDDYRGKELWSTLQRTSDATDTRYYIIVSRDEVKPKQGTWLKKPIQSAALLQAIVNVNNDRKHAQTVEARNSLFAEQRTRRLSQVGISQKPISASMQSAPKNQSGGKK